MSRDKQTEIDEIAKLICTYPQCVNYNKIGGCKIAECQTVDIAEKLFDKGYRKASDVAREIFAEIEKIIEVDKFGEAKFDVRELYEIEKKYESEGGE